MGVLRTIPEFIKNRSKEYNKLFNNVYFLTLENTYRNYTYDQQRHTAIINALPPVVGDFKRIK